MMEISRLSMPFFLNTTVNCYLIQTQHGFVLIDTGTCKQRATVEAFLLDAGCTPENLNLIVLTHGDFDHIGNAAYLKRKFSAIVAMHEADSGMVEYGDMFWNRKQPNFIMKTVMDWLIKLDDSDRFTPDVHLREGDNLRTYDFAAHIIELPGHSSGSIGLLTPGGHLFCGDLLANVDKPDVWTIVDDAQAMTDSVSRLRKMDIQMVYPGHGDPFPMHAFLRNISKQKATT